MSTYKEEIIGYFTKKDNFISAYEIYQLFPEVKNSLLEQFWHSVKKSLEELTKDTIWKVDISEDIFETYSQLSMWFDENIFVAIQKLNGQAYYGLLINFENKNLNREQIDKYAANIDSISEMKKQKWWLGLEETGDNFNNIETLKKILPDNREDFAQELAKMLFDFGEELKKDIVKMNKMIKK